MEEALRRNGKEFNESAIKENTELKVDKVTLQRDLKHYRKLLAQAEKDLEEYRQQLKDYMDKVKRRHASEGMQEELDQLRKALDSSEAEVKSLNDKLETSSDLQQQVDKLQDECGDLEAELREKDRELDEKDDQLEKLREDGNDGDDLASRLQDHERLLAEAKDELERVQRDLQNARSEADERQLDKNRKLDEAQATISSLEGQLESADSDKKALTRSQQDLKARDDLLRKKDEEIETLRRELDEGAGDKSIIRTRDQDAASKQAEIDDLRADLAEAQRKAGRVDDLEKQVKAANQQIEDQRQASTQEADDHASQLKTLRQKLETGSARDEQSEKLQDQIGDLEADLRDKSRLIDEKEEELVSCTALQCRTPNTDRTCRNPSTMRSRRRSNKLMKTCRHARTESWNSRVYRNVI